MADIKLSKILIVDLEMSCWENMTRQEQFEKSKIIEIGITEVNTVTKEIIKMKSYLINQKNVEISDFCTTLTGITKEMILTEGISLEKASKEIRQEFGSTNCYYGAWGSDNEALDRDFLARKAINPFSKYYINLQNLYSLQNGLSKTIKMTDALKNNDLILEGSLHRAGDDSLNTAKLFLKSMIK